MKRNYMYLSDTSGRVSRGKKICWLSVVLTKDIVWHVSSEKQCISMPWTELETYIGYRHTFHSYVYLFVASPSEDYFAKNISRCAVQLKISITYIHKKALILTVFPFYWYYKSAGRVLLFLWLILYITLFFKHIIIINFIMFI